MIKQATSASLGFLLGLILLIGPALAPIAKAQTPLIATQLVSCSAAALAIDSSENVGHHSTTSPGTSSFTNTAGGLIEVWVALTMIAQAGNADYTVTATYNGVSMTQDGAYLDWSAFKDSLYHFSLEAPATGAHNIVITAAGGTGLADLIWQGRSFAHAKTSSPTGTMATATANSGTASVSLPGTTKGSIISSAVQTGTGVNSANAPTVLQALLNVSNASAGDNLASGQQSTGGGAVTPSYSVASDLWAASAIEVFAANNCAAAPPPPSARGFALGIKPGGGSGTNDLAQFNLDQSQIGGTMEAVQTYLFGGGTIQGSGFGQFGTTPIYPISMYPGNFNNAVGNPAVSNQSMANGALDGPWQTMLNQLVADHNAGYNISGIRLFWENGNFTNNTPWFSWQVDNGTGQSAGTGNTPVNSVAAFRHLALMVRATAPWAMIEWNTELGATGGDDTNLYPGDDVVDIIGTDLYFGSNVGFNPGTTAGFNQARAGYNGFIGLDAMVAFAASTHGINAPAGKTGGSKWIAFSETGAGCGGVNGGNYCTPNYDPGGTITNFTNWAAGLSPSRLTYYLWWNGSDGGSTRLGPAPASPAGAAAFVAAQTAKPLRALWIGQPGGRP